MAPPPSSTEASPALAYLLLVLSTAESFKADYRTVAEKASLSTPKVAQRKFKKVVEQFGFTLVDGMVRAAARNSASVSVAKGGKRKAEGGGKGVGSAKRMKKDDDEDVDDGGEDEVNGGDEETCEDEKACGDEEACEETRGRSIKGDIMEFECA